MVSTSGAVGAITSSQSFKDKNDEDVEPGCEEESASRPKQSDSDAAGS